MPLLPDYSADVRKLAEAADRAHGGLIHICNPNNPTSSITKKAGISWLVQNLPSHTVLLIDEAYIHFGESEDLETALPYVRQGKNVVVARTPVEDLRNGGRPRGIRVCPARTHRADAAIPT